MTMDINDLIVADKKSPKRIAVLGDPLLDHWITGEATSCQDGCMRLNEKKVRITGGGAANAARQLVHWRSRAVLLGPQSLLPSKVRYLDENGRIVFRHDREDHQYGMTNDQMTTCRRDALERLRAEEWHAVLVSDYDKGFLSEEMIRYVIDWCSDHKLPVVVDGKRLPRLYAGAILKVNEDYLRKYEVSQVPGSVVTMGKGRPLIYHKEVWPITAQTVNTPVSCVNHVGAGDCFAIHLALGLAHGMSLPEAVIVAHAAGRVFVQYPFSRPPWPHEARKDIEPVPGKFLDKEDVAALRASLAGKKVVFTNGRFRLVHSGHAWLFDWARQQGDVLVVGINDHEEASGLLSLDARLGMIASMQAVDWVVPFTEETPCELLRELQPSLLVKGHEYAGQQVPGHDLVSEVKFAPEGPFAAHATDIISTIKRNG